MCLCVCVSVCVSTPASVLFRIPHNPQPTTHNLQFDGALDAAVALGDRLSATRRLRPHLSLGSLTSLLLEVRRQWRVRCTAERQQETLQRAAALRRSLVAAGDVADELEWRTVLAAGSGIDANPPDVPGCKNTGNPYHACSDFCAGRGVCVYAAFRREHAGSQHAGSQHESGMLAPSAIRIPLQLQAQLRVSAGCTAFCFVGFFFFTCMRTEGNTKSDTHTRTHTHTHAHIHMHVLIHFRL